MKKSKALSIGLVACMVLSFVDPAMFIPTEVIAASTEKIDSVLQERMNDSGVELPVAVWYKEFDNDELEAKIEAQIGYSLNDLEEVYSSPSPELIASLEEAAQKLEEENGNICKSDEQVEQLLSSFVSENEEARQREEERTDAYLKAKREMCAESHYETATRITHSCNIASENIAYICKYAPLIICSLTSDDILELAQCEDVETLCLYDEDEMVIEDSELPSRSVDPALEASYNDNNESVGTTKVFTHFNINSSNAKIGFFANNHVACTASDLNNLDPNLVGLINPNNVTIVCDSSPYSYNPDKHHTWCATIAGGTYGVAPNAQIYSASWANEYSNWTSSNLITQNLPLPDYEALMDVSDVVCWETVWISLSTPIYTEKEKYIDSAIKNTGVLNIVPSGNRDVNGTYDSHYNIAQPGNAYNAITVAGYIAGCGDTPDTLLANSNYLNGNHCLKPDIVAPAKLGNTTGTSYAAPIIAGMIALLLQFKPSLKAKPEVAKAILMASCHRRVEENMTDGLSDHQGAGVPNLYTMFNIVAQQTYGYGCLKNTNNFTQTRYLNQKKYGASKTNLCLAYLHSGTGNANGDSLDVNITLKKRVGNTTIDSSSYSHSSVEMMYFNTENWGYKLEIYKNGSNQEITPYGYAWSTNKTFNYNVTNRNNEDIVCFLRNSGSGYYLTQNTSGEILTQETYTGNLNQLWLLTENQLSSDYTIANANSKDYGIVKGASLGGGYYKANISTGGTVPIDLLNIWDGSQQILFSNYGLVTQNSSLIVGCPLAWKLFDTTNDAQKWFLEVVPYYKGDANHDGVLDTADVTKIQTMITGMQSGQKYINLEMYLADFDSNGVVNNADKNALTTYITTPGNN